MIVKFDKVNEKTWNDALVEAGPQGTIFQSTHWAEYLRRAFADRPIYMASVNSRGETQGQLLAIETCYAKHSALTMSGTRGLLIGKVYKCAISPLFHKILPSIIWENGPIFPKFSNQHSEQKSDVYREIIEGIVDEAHNRNCYGVRFARPAFFSDNQETFSSLNFQERRMGTILINLDQRLEVLWERIDNDARRTVRRGIEQGVKITKISNLDGLKEFYELNLQSSARAGQKIYPFSRLTALWNHFLPLNKIVVFVAHIKERPVAGALYLMHNKIIHIYILGDSDYARSRKVFGNEVLMWHVIKWAREMGLKYFDHSGVEIHKIDSGDQKARAICRFKLKWGGDIVEYHDYEKHLQEKRLVKWLNCFLADSVIHN